MSGHTPGPWIVRDHPEGRAGVSLPTGRMIARCEAMFGRSHAASSEWEANARLIAAAPCLATNGKAVADWLQACLECADYKWDGDQRECAELALSEMRAALARVGAL